MNVKIEDITWQQFQDLCIDILQQEGYNILRKSGVGSDRGMDVLVEKYIEFAPGHKKLFVWLVQCKHKLKGSIKPDDVGEFITDLPRHNADGYWLMTNAYLSTGLEDKIVAVDNNSSLPYKATYSNGNDIINLASKHREIYKKYFYQGKISTAIANWKEINPYKELQSYSEIDHDFFFGRATEINELLEKIYRYKVVGIFGESGTGKTSIINAGLVPNLKNEEFIIISIRALDAPVKRIREETLRVCKHDNIPNQDIEELLLTLNFRDFILSLKSIIEREAKSVVIIIDQLEEIFTRASELEREQLAKGITEAIIQSNTKSKVTFLLAIREDFVGDLWGWSHKYTLEDAWVHAYRLIRLSEDEAYQAITSPLKILNVQFTEDFINILVQALLKIGIGLIYPPYLQIICSILYDRYKSQATTSDKKFDKWLLNKDETVEVIIADYLSESMLYGLTEDEKLVAQGILDLLTGPEGLRNFLTIDEIAKYLSNDVGGTQHIIEHLTKRKVVHAIVEEDVIMGYELVHDFLSKRFFESLGLDQKKQKTVIDIFRKAFKDWTQHSILASKDRLELLYVNLASLSLDYDEWKFLIKSSFSNYWFYNNNWVKRIDKDYLLSICKELIHDKDYEIVKSAIRALGRICDEEGFLLIKKIIEDNSNKHDIRETAIDVFWWDLTDERILDTFCNIILHAPEFKLRKTALYSLAKNVARLNQSKIFDERIIIIYKALHDSRAPVRKQAADVLGNVLINKEAVKPLIHRFRIETSVPTKKSIILALQHFGKNESVVQLLRTIASDSKQDYRVIEEAKLALGYIQLRS